MTVFIRTVDLFRRYFFEILVVLLKAYLAGKPLLSTTDWPATACCVAFFAGCNFRCRFCFNTPLLDFKDEFHVDLSNVFDELKEHRYLIDGVIASGGEPTLQPEALQALAKWSHKQELKFGIMTNGTKPDVIKKLLNENLLDFVAVDIKTVPNEKDYTQITQAKPPLLSDIQTTISLLDSSQVEKEYRTTLVPSIIDKVAQIKQIMNWVGPEHYVLQNFRPTNTILDPVLSKSFSLEELDKFREFAKTHQVKTRF
jgi:pyruvate formate lyase activating enzyme